jgi:hypothetical protein
MRIDSDGETNHNAVRGPAIPCSTVLTTCASTGMKTADGRPIRRQTQEAPEAPLAPVALALDPNRGPWLREPNLLAGRIPIIFFMSSLP